MRWTWGPTKRELKKKARMQKEAEENNKWQSFVKERFPASVCLLGSGYD